MNIAIIGGPKAGKTTIFNALTGLSAEISDYTSQKVEPNRGVVDVLDPRVDKLSEHYRPQRKVYAVVEFVDFAGLSAGAAQHGLFSGEAMQLIKNSDALAVVARNFSSPVVDESYGTPDPAAEAENIVTELILSDQILAERRLERIKTDMQRGKKTPGLPAEEKVMHKVTAHLETGRPLLELELGPDEQKSISSLQFLSAKPVFVILNSSEENYGHNQDIITAIEKEHPVVEFSGNFEMELKMLDDDEERAAFMADMGITESAQTRLTTFAYRCLGYISFFTVGDDEVRAWTIRSSGSAVEAAGAIHTDLARGFIRAEVFTYDDFINFGSEKAIKTAGKLRVEGKTYQVQDGDIINVRFSV